MDLPTICVAAVYEKHITLTVAGDQLSDLLAFQSFQVGCAQYKVDLLYGVAARLRITVSYGDRRAAALQKVGMGSLNVSSQRGAVYVGLRADRTVLGVCISFF